MTPFTQDLNPVPSTRRLDPPGLWKRVAFISLLAHLAIIGGIQLGLQGEKEGVDQSTSTISTTMPNTYEVLPPSPNTIITPLPVQATPKAQSPTPQSPVVTPVKPTVSPARRSEQVQFLTSPQPKPSQPQRQEPTIKLPARTITRVTPSPPPHPQPPITPPKSKPTPIVTPETIVTPPVPKPEVEKSPKPQSVPISTTPTPEQTETPSPGGGIVVMLDEPRLTVSDRDLPDRLARPKQTYQTLNLESLKGIVKGSLVLETIVVIEANGSVTVYPESTQVLEGAIETEKGAEIAQAIVGQWTFEPTYMNGQPVTQEYLIRFKVTPEDQ